MHALQRVSPASIVTAYRRNEWQAVLDSGNGPTANIHHERLIEGLAGLDPDAILSTDAETMRATGARLLAIVWDVLDDRLNGGSQA